MSKKYWIGSVAFAGLLVGSFSAGSLVLAADADSGSTNTSVTVTPGSIGLSAPNSLTFPSLSVESIVKGDLNENVNTSDSSILTVSDFRGTGSGYSVTAKASPIATSSGAELKGAVIKLVPDATTTTNSVSPDWTKPVALNTTAQQLFATTTTLDGAGISSYDLNKTTLAVPQDNTVKAGSYSGVITFTLTPGQPAQAATANPNPS